MRTRKFLFLIIALVLVISFSSCFDNAGDTGKEPPSEEEKEPKVEVTYDENGNVAREDYYNENDELEEYIIYDYDENNVLKMSSTYDENGVKRLYVEYEYDENGKLFSDNTVHVDEKGNQLERYFVEYYESGNRHKVSSFDANDERIALEIFGENGACVYSDMRIFDENGKCVGRRVVENTEQLLVTKEEEYDADDVLVRLSTYSYHDNGEMKESKQINGKGETVNHTINDENGENVYRELNSFHDNGQLSVHEVSEYKNGISYIDIVKYDEGGKQISREINESTKEGPIKNVIYGAENELIYYKDAHKLEESIFTEGGVYNGKRYVEYFDNGEMKLERETDAQGRVTLLYEYSENGVLLINESRVYNASGVLVEYSFEEINAAGVILKNERVKYDGNGNVVDKYVAIYDEYGNVLTDERIESGVLKYKYTAEYYDGVKLKREESYQNDAPTVMSRIVEYDEEGRILYQYDCNENSEINIKTETYNRLRYNSAGVIVYQECKFPQGDMVIEEYYDNGNIKKSETTGEGGRRYILLEYSESGEIIKSQTVMHNDAGQKLSEHKSELINGSMVESRDEYRYNEAGVLVSFDHDGADGSISIEYYDNGKMCTYRKFADHMRNNLVLFESYDENGVLSGRVEYDENGNPLF